MNKFQCQHCGSGKLAYVQYKKHVIPVELDPNGYLVYLYPIIDEDNAIVNEQGYCCGECGQMLQHHTLRIRTEAELINYLSYFSPEKRIF